MSAEKQLTVLIVEDEAKIAKLLQDYLHNEGYRSHWIDHGDNVLDWVRQAQPDLILLDLMLPGKDGITLCRELRSFTDVPIIMVTARIEEVDRILGLDIGANDYVCKPFSPREVMARIRALFRTLGHHPSTPTDKPVSLDEQQMLAVISGHSVELTHIEYRLLSTLVKQPGRIFSRSQLMDNLYEDNRVVTDRTVDSHIKNLRKKIAKYHNDQEMIKSVYGVGYKYELHD